MYRTQPCRWNIRSKLKCQNYDSLSQCPSTIIIAWWAGNCGVGMCICATDGIDMNGVQVQLVNVDLVFTPVDAHEIQKRL